jgi:hypothetical protein
MNPEFKGYNLFAKAVVTVLPVLLIAPVFSSLML